MSKPISLTQTRHSLWALMLGAAVCLNGCTPGVSDLHAWVAHEKAQKVAPIQPLPVVKTFETFTYSDQNRRDPFGPSAAELQDTTDATSGPRPDADRPKQPLEMFALDSLKMVGSIGSGPGTEALVKDPGGVIHRIHVGDYMGQNYGHVTAITDGDITLVETVSNGNRGWMDRAAGIELDTK